MLAVVLGETGPFQTTGEKLREESGPGWCWGIAAYVVSMRTVGL